MYLYYMVTKNILRAHEGKYVYQVVGMSADEYASKELQEWREQEAKKDIEVIMLNRHGQILHELR